MATCKKGLLGLEGISMNPEPEGTINGAWMPSVVFDESIGITREKLQKVFADQNADARVFFWPLSSLDIFDSVRQNVNSWSIPQRAINLPSYHDLTFNEIATIVRIVSALT
ncbi:MAG: DegT/DnrJ/EryC1/StrS family aminotransferase [Thiohalophilus sp.]|nr:DegT/DnrJ/EryC1/StrS family aminotransferase [Thiohalophilus sp.]MDZ7804397.1 DegT/DnrJ/EryC1/StrS family aminotransferase [Thiohalophilus sp.]